MLGSVLYFLSLGFCSSYLYFSTLGSTAQPSSWHPPQNPTEFLGGFSTINYLHL